MSMSLEELRNSVKDFSDVFRTLMSDFDEASNLIFEDASNFRIRTYVRTFFALVEGTLFSLKQIALKVHEYQPCFTHAEVSLLREVTYELDRGKVKERTKFLDTLNNLRFAVKCFSKAFGFIESANLFNSTGWQHFQRALEIRHQITHPKNAASLAISELDDGKGSKVDIIVEASEWYTNLVAATSQSLIATTKEMYETRRTFDRENIMGLSKERWLEIDELLPNVPHTQKRVIALSPSMVAFVTGPNSRFDVACVCLQDACDIACDAVYALGQAHAHLVWLREDSPDAPNELGAAIRSRFYIDDIALRLYAAAEHTANFIICYLNIDKADLKPYENKHSSLQQRIGRYVLDKYPNHEIALYIQALIDEESWKNTMHYRNIWVHEQPPLIDNVGIVSKRKGRWRKSGNTYRLGFASGDKPKYTVDQLLQMTSSATYAFGDLLEELTSMFIRSLEDLGITFEAGSDEINMTL